MGGWHGFFCFCPGWDFQGWVFFLSPVLMGTVTEAHLSELAGRYGEFYLLWPSAAWLRGSRMIGDDLAYKRGPLVSCKLWNSFSCLWKAVETEAFWQAGLHCDGNIQFCCLNQKSRFRLIPPSRQRVWNWAGPKKWAGSLPDGQYGSGLAVRETKSGNNAEGSKDCTERGFI